MGIFREEDWEHLGRSRSSYCGGVAIFREETWKL